MPFHYVCSEREVKIRQSFRQNKAASIYLFKLQVEIILKNNLNYPTVTTL